MFAWARKKLESMLPALLLAPLLCALSAPQPVHAVQTEQVIVDTDIGDDIDDAFALGLLLNSPASRSWVLPRPGATPDCACSCCNACCTKPVTAASRLRAVSPPPA
nr:hypothetical protein [Collimonas fungivorans]